VSCAKPVDGASRPTAPEIRTERLVLSVLEEGDAADLLAYRALPDVSRFQTWEPSTTDDARGFIGRVKDVAFDTPGAWFQFGIRLREGGRLVGDLGVHAPFDDSRQAEVGVSLDPTHQGQGLATEALAGVLRYLFEACGKHRVFASVDPRNAASIALMERVGMRQEAHFRQSLWFKGEWADDLVFAVLESDRMRP
jgi:RimJ/RimL family protein N-acetyltransferase